MKDFDRRKAAQIDYLENGEYAFILIPKCMSSVMRTGLKNLGWAYSTNTKAKTVFSIARDPVERWVSGMAQTFYNKPEYVKEIKSNFDSVLKVPWYDPHTSKQIWYYEKDGVEVFRLDQIDLLSKWLKERDIGVTWQDYDSVEKIEEKEELKKYISKNLTKKNKKRLREYYSEDYELYKSSDRSKK